MRLKVVFLFVLLLLCNILQAQKYEVMVTKNLPAYEGTWQYATATDTFTLVLKTGKSIISEGIDVVFGLHYYKKNGVIIDNYIELTPNQDNWTFEATNARYQEYQDRVKPYSLSVTYVDNNKQRDEWMDGRFDLNPNNPKEMTWTLTQKEREVLYLGEAPPPQDMSSTIPKTMVLKKIK